MAAWLPRSTAAAIIITGTIGATTGTTAIITATAEAAARPA